MIACATGVRRALAFGALAVALTGCGDRGRDTTLVVRTSYPRELRRDVERSFEAAHPSIDLRFTAADELETRVELSDPKGPDFDVWWGASATTLQSADEQGWLDGGWQEFLITPFVIAFDRNQVPVTRAPVDWLDLFHFRWAEDVGALDPRSTPEGEWFVAATIVESLREHDDPLPGFDWLARLDPQVPEWDDSAADILRGLRAGRPRLAILPRAWVERARAEDNPLLYYRIPESGTPSLVQGVAVVRGTASPEAARRFVEYLASSDVATASKRVTRWEPVAGDVDAASLPDDFELSQPWTPRVMAADTILNQSKVWVDRWDNEVRGR